MAIQLSEDKKKVSMAGVHLRSLISMHTVLYDALG